MMVLILSKPAWVRLLSAAGILLVVLGIGMAVLVTHITPIVRARAIDMLRSRFDSDAEFGELHVMVLHGIFVRGKNLVLRHRGRTDVPPLLDIREFSGEMSLLSLFRKPWHIRRVELKGMAIHIPPKSEREPEPRKKLRDIPVIVDEFISDDADLDLLPRNPDRPVHQFLIHHPLLPSVGLGHSAPFQARLTTAVPPGEITTQGHFGPWRMDEPRQTPLTAKYVFKSAAPGVFRALS